MLNIFVLKERKENEARVAMTPAIVKEIKKLGVNLFIEEEAGKTAFFNDDSYKKQGVAIIADPKEGISNADLVIALNGPSSFSGLDDLDKHPFDLLKEDANWVSMSVPQEELESIKKAQERKINFFSLNLMPRITRAQSMDVLSSQSNLAGYKAVIVAAENLKKSFPLMMTAAGTINPAKVVVLGAGVAGLQAIATAKRLGAQVEASDIRPQTKEQIESLGAKYIEVFDSADSSTREAMEDEKGYAKEVSKEFLDKQAQEVAKRIKEADAVITTALIPGKKAPILITEEMVKSMKPGSVIVDLAASMGGNCALTEADKIKEVEGVTIIGESNLSAKIAVDASQVYAENIKNFLKELIKEGELKLDLENEVIRDCLIVYKGEIVHKPVK